MLAITFAFGFLISITFGWIVVCIFYLSMQPDLVNTPYDVFMIIMTVSAPPVMVWMIVAIIYNSFFIRKLAMMQSFLASEIRNSSEAYRQDIERKESFQIIKVIPMITTCLNNILASILVNMEIISSEDLSRLWRMIGSGDTEALARDFLRRINLSELRARTINDDKLKASIIRYCERFDRLLMLIEKYDSDKIVGESFEITDYSRIYAVFSGISVKSLLNRVNKTEDNVEISNEEIEEENNEGQEDVEEPLLNKAKDSFDFASHKSDLLREYLHADINKEDKND